MTTIPGSVEPVAVGAENVSPAPGSGPDSAAPSIDPIIALLDGMDLRHKIGQMLIVSFEGTSANEASLEARAANLTAAGGTTPAHIVRTRHVGGVILFSANLPTIPGAADLIADLQVASSEGSGIGLFVAVDEEGGRVRRLPEPATAFPAASVFGRVDDSSLTGRAAVAVGTELAALGVNLLLAPVADVGSSTSFIGDRSYGDDPSAVSRHVTAAIEQYQTTGVVPAAKHFPGHGATSVDSHRELPTIGLTMAEWLHRDRPPFEAAISAGVDVVMLGHLALPAMDPTGVPATVSEPIVSYLREQLGFEGLIVTDSLQMDAVADVDDLAVRAVEAGVDVLLMPADVDGTVEALVQAVESGRISEARIDRSVEAILRLKATAGLLDPFADSTTDLSVVGNVDHRAILSEIERAEESSRPPETTTTGAAHEPNT